MGRRHHRHPRNRYLRARLHSFLSLNRSPPFIGEKLSDVMHGHTSQAPPALNTFRSDVPAALEQILTKMLAKDPEDRFRQAKEVVDSLRKVPLEPEMSTINRPVRRSAPQEAPAKPARRKTSWVLLAPLIALTAGIGNCLVVVLPTTLE